MKMSVVLALALSVAAVPAVADQPAGTAAAAPAVAKGAIIFSADGHRVGRVDIVRASIVSLIYNGKFIDIPVGTLSASDKGYTTSLAKADLSKL